VFDIATGESLTSYNMPNATRCYMHEDGECITCVPPDGNNTLAVEFDTRANTGYEQTQLDGTNRFVTGSLTSRTIVFGQQEANSSVMNVCNRELVRTKVTNPLNRAAAFIPLNR
jgi:hypothetical protein